MKYLLAALGPIALDAVSEVVVLNQHDIKCFGWQPKGPDYTISKIRSDPAVLVLYVLPVITASV